MKLSTRSRYGTRTMLEFARHWGSGPMSLTEAAAAQRISLKYLEHIVASLKSAGLLHAARGRRGGYELARPPEKIRLDEVVEALEGSVDPVDCLADQAVCPMMDVCPTRGLWADMKQAITGVLAATTLKDLLDRSTPPNDPGQSDD
jgi:Rrf2 family protein